MPPPDRGRGPPQKRERRAGQRRAVDLESSRNGRFSNRTEAAAQPRRSRPSQRPIKAAAALLAAAAMSVALDVGRAAPLRQGALDMPRMRLIPFRPISKGALRGFASMELPIGLVIEDCPVLVGNNGAWAALPSKPVLDQEGRRAKPDGEPQYAAIMKWRDRELQDRFSQAVIELVRAAHPDVLEDGVA